MRQGEYGCSVLLSLRRQEGKLCVCSAPRCGNFTHRRRISRSAQKGEFHVQRKKADFVFTRKKVNFTVTRKKADFIKKASLTTCFFLEAPPGLEPGVEVLQTSALPLGYSAIFLERKTGLEPATFTLAR